MAKKKNIDGSPKTPPKPKGGERKKAKKLTLEERVINLERALMGDLSNRYMIEMCRMKDVEAIQMGNQIGIFNTFMEENPEVKQLFEEWQKAKIEEQEKARKEELKRKADEIRKKRKQERDEEETDETDN